MPIASVMAEEVKPDEPGAPVPDGAIDPALVKLGRKPLHIGAITALGILLLCAYFAVKLGPDRAFARQDDKARHVTAAEVASGGVDADSYVALHGEPLMAHSIRAADSKSTPGLRVSPIRGTGDRVWVVQAGDTFGEPTPDAYTGRLKKLADLPLDKTVREFAHDNPRPVFATPAAVKAALASNELETVTKDKLPVAPGDKVAYDVVDPNSAVIVAAFVDGLMDVKAWATALDKAGIKVKGDALVEGDGVRFDVTADNAVKTTTGALETAGLFAARVDAVTRHAETTWSALAKDSSWSGADLVGIYVARTIPDDAYAVIVGEQPDDYWYVLPITIALAVVGALFGWMLVRAIRRDWLPAK